MNKHSFRFLNIKPMLCNRMGTSSDPFNAAAGTNIFDAAAKRAQEGNGRMPPAGATDFVPSNIVPNQMVPGTPSTGQNGQLGHKVGNSEQSPLASYMGDDYAKYSEQAGQNGQGQEGQGKDGQQAKPKGAFDAELSDFDGIVKSHSFVRPEDEDLANKAIKGDPKALMQLLNSVGQRASSSAAFLSTKVAQNGVASELEAYGKNLPTQLVEREFSTLLDGEQDGVLADPKVKPMLQSTVDMFRKQYPKAPPAAIKKAVTAYLSDLTGYNSRKQTEEKETASAGTEWDGFFDN